MSDGIPVISVVSPVYGCDQCLWRLVDGINAAGKSLGCAVEIILVDDASPDNAWATIASIAEVTPNVIGIRHSRNFGQHAAISTGISRTTGDWVVVLDCDLQDPPEEIPALYEEALSKGLDVVFAQRVNRQDSASKRFASWSFNRTLSWLTGVPHDESTANFGIYRRPVIDAVVAMPERDRAFPLMVKWVGFNTGYLPVRHQPRTEGSSSYTLARMLKLARGIVLGYSDKPLRMVATGGVICALVSFLLAFGAIVMFVQGQIQVAGYTSVIASIWLLGGLTLLSLGVVGLYVGQVFENVQGRPSAIVRDVVGSPSKDSSAPRMAPTGEAEGPPSQD